MMSSLVGPNEDFETYHKRILASRDFFLNYKPNPKEFILEKQIDLPLLKSFDIDVKWVRVIFSNHQISPWQGAIFWILIDKDKNINPLIQLRECLKDKDNFLCIYSKEEILSHEAIHAARITFNDPKFEEILAYRVNNGSFRKFFGPIFQKPVEVLVLLLIFILSFVLQFIGIFLEENISFLGSVFLFLAPIVFLLVRLTYLQNRFSSALTKIEALGIKNPESLAIRLTDIEILFFAKSELKEILSYIKENKTFRWQVIKEKYFSYLEN